MNQDLPTTPAAPADTAALLASELLSADEFDEIDAILDELRTRYDETP
ncbi:MAG: zinc chelation protein SecC, partial [Pseudomonadota bacterium]